MSSSVAAPKVRITSVDWLRGVVMIVMALDHVRYFVTNVPFAPEDIEKTTLALFLTRWVTHYCAPAFFFLAGTSAYLSGRSKTPGAVSARLVKRGLVLVVLELTVMGFAWRFTPGYSFAGVIWTLGWSMVLLAVLSRIPAAWLAAISIVVIAGHDLLFGISAEVTGSFESLWRFLHRSGPVDVFGVRYHVLFSIIPWFAVMSLGYAAGRLWNMDAERRRRWLLAIGIGATVLFVVLRMTNAYGNPVGPGKGRDPFQFYGDWDRTLISLLNTAKYPASLQFLLMTLGPSLIALALFERWAAGRELRGLTRATITFGRVPMFYYVLHLYSCHLVALALAIAVGQPHQWLGWRPERGPVPPPGYGHGLLVVYGLWVLVVVMLYFPSRWFEKVKERSQSAWLGYI